MDAIGNPQGFVGGKLSTDYQAIREEGNTKGLKGNIIYIGPTSPVVFGSVINSILWKGISFSVNVIYKLGYYFKKPYYSSIALIDGQGNKEFANRWQHPGDEAHTSVPAFIYPGNDRRASFYGNASINILRADNIRLHYVNLSYLLPDFTSNRLPFKRIQLYFNAADLGIIWRANDKKFDPDYPASLPPQTSFTIGLRTTF